MTQTRAFTVASLPEKAAMPNRFLRAALLLVPLFAIAVDAGAQVSLRVRGTITGFDGNVLSVKTREGKDLKLQLSEKTVVVAAKALRLDDLKPGDYVGTTTQTRADGTLVALEVHTLSPTTKPGHIKWDLEPGSMMTNGNVTGAVTRSPDGQRLTLEYQGGSQTVLVPTGTPIVTNEPADRSALRTGEYIFTSAAVAADGTLTVGRITVSRGGVKPPQ
jgi:hypothetical protein